RLVKKYTNNLTIIYDGDAAGVKAALRGLDMALEEGLNVKLVLIPDNEDPDSYVNKVGVKAFQDFVATNRKDFVLFQLEIALKDAANDTTKKATVVNQVAETISKINKTEDFTKQQDYIKQSAALLKIDEEGLTSLVNKFIRERINKMESRMPADETKIFDQDTSSATREFDAGLDLLQRDELQERALVRALLEFGTKEWDENNTVATIIFQEAAEQDLIDNPVLRRVVQTYKSWYEAGLAPTDKTFIYHEDTELSSLVVSIMDFPYELSHNWKEHFEGKIYTREELYREEVLSVLTYLKLRKIKVLIAENQKDLERPHTTEEQLMLIQTHQHLKQMERELTGKLGTVIVK
ncbi:MAG TPA: toprim domain-containing protein, partial [Chitinophagaceae bacterium]